MTNFIVVHLAFLGFCPFIMVQILSLYLIKLQVACNRIMNNNKSYLGMIACCTYSNNDTNYIIIFFCKICAMIRFINQNQVSYII